MKRLFFLLLLIFTACSNMNTDLAREQEQQILAKVDSLLQLAEQESQAVVAADFAEKAYQLAAAAKIKEAMARAAYVSGLKQKLWGNQKLSVSRLEEAMLYYRDEAADEMMANMVLVDLGETYRAAGNLEYAAALLNQAMQYFEKQQDEAQLAKVYDRQAAVFFELLYNHPIMDTIRQRQDLPTARLMDTIMKYQDTKILRDSLLILIDQSNTIATRNNLYDLIISTQIIKAAYLRVTNQFDEAMKVYSELQVLTANQQKFYDMPLILINKASLLHLLSKEANIEALALLEQSIELSRKYQIRIYLAMAYEMIHQVYADLNEHEKAYAYLLLSHRTYLEIFDDHKVLLLKSKDEEYRLQEMAALEAAEKTQNKLLLLSLALIIVVVLFFAGILYRKNIVKRKLLHELQSKNELILQQHDDLKKLIHQKDIFLSIIAHDLKSPLSSIYGLSTLLVESLDEHADDQTANFASYIQRSSAKTIDLLNNLIIWIKSQTGKLQFEFTELNINDVVNEVLATYQDTARAKNIQIYNNVPGVILAHGDAQTLQTVLRNLIFNAIKFTHPGGEININALQQEDSIQVSVSDNGIGISAKMQEDIFKLHKNTGREGTAGEASTGLGLLLCKELMEMNRGAIGLESVEGKGSRFFFTLPVSG